MVFLKCEWFTKFVLNEEEKSELSEYLEGKKTKKVSFSTFFVVTRNYRLKKENWGNDESSSLFDAYEQNENYIFLDADISKKTISMRGGEYWSIDHFVENKNFIFIACSMIM